MVKKLQVIFTQEKKSIVPISLHSSFYMLCAWQRSSDCLFQSLWYDLARIDSITSCTCGILNVLQDHKSSIYKKQNINTCRSCVKRCHFIFYVHVYLYKYNLKIDLCTLLFMLTCKRNIYRYIVNILPMHFNGINYN